MVKPGVVLQQVSQRIKLYMRERERKREREREREREGGVISSFEVVHILLTSMSPSLEERRPPESASAAEK